MPNKLPMQPIVLDDHGTVRFQENHIVRYLLDAGANFSHSELHRKKTSDMHDMLHSIGKNWTKDLLPVERNGTFIVGKDLVLNQEILPDYKSISSIIEPLLLTKQEKELQNEQAPCTA